MWRVFNPKIQKCILYTLLHAWDDSRPYARSLYFQRVFVCFTEDKHQMNTIPNNTSVMKPIILCVILYRHTLCDWQLETLKLCTSLENKAKQSFLYSPPSLRLKHHVTTRKHKEGTESANQHMLTFNSLVIKTYLKS